MNSKNTDTTLELNLLDNGVDFILKGIDELFDEDHVIREYSNATDVAASSYKYGVLNLFSGFLLLLKERLHRHLPSLIFKGKISDIRQKLAPNKSNKLNTIDLDEALERLEMGPKFLFSEDELEIIRSVQDIRNQFEHYKVSINKYSLWKNLSKFLELIDKFLVNELQINIEATAVNSELLRKLHTIESVWKRVSQQRKQELFKNLQIMQEEFRTNQENIVKKLELVYHSEKGGIQVYTDCPDCYHDTLIVYGNYKGICTNTECDSVHSLTECTRCRKITTGFPWEGEINFCDACMDWMQDQ